MISTPHALGAAPAHRLGRWLGVAGLVASILLIWMMRHGYEGITHDAQLYSFQAMVRLKPELLGNDLYLRFGSQDNYTLFSPLFAALIAALGWEPAAALITLLSHLAFVLAGWVLARQFMPRVAAWLSTALLIALPGVYGAQGVWNYMEGFVTPRLPCEALVLASLAAMVKRRYWLTVAGLLASVTLHPLMAAAGLAVAACMWAWTLPHATRTRFLWLTIGGAALALAAASTAPQLRMPDEWVSLVYERQKFLFLTQWDPADWARAGVYLTTLSIGALVLPRETAARLISLSAVIVAVAGLLISYIGADLLHLTLVIQLQVWRWIWLGAVLSALLAPLIATACVQRGQIGLLTLLLLIASWLAIDEPYSILVAPLAIAAAIGTRLGLPDSRAHRTMVMGAVALLVLVLVRSLFNAHLAAEGLPDQSQMPEIIRQIRAHSHDGLLPFLLVTGLWWLLTSDLARAARPVIATICVVACLALVPASAAEWQHRDFPQSDFDAFESWRQLIPPRNEVLWIEGSVPTWALLERPRYLTNNQMASVLFSEGARTELRKRAKQLAPFAEGAPYIFWSRDLALIRHGVPPSLDSLCSAIEARFIVTRQDLAAEPIATAPPGASLPYRGLKLYRCAQ